MPPPNNNFQPQHRPLPAGLKKGGENPKPQGPRPPPPPAPPRPPCKNCGPQMQMRMGNQFGGPQEGIALPTTRQPVGGLGKPLMTPAGMPVPMEQLEEALAQHLIDEQKLTEAPGAMNAGVGQKLRESMAAGGLPSEAVKAIFLELRNLHVEIGALKIALMGPGRPLVTEADLAQYRAMYEQQMDEQMRQMAAQLGRQFQPPPRQHSPPAPSDPRTPQ